MALLEGADRSLAYASGMAAISAVCRLVKSGEHIVAGDDIYGGTSRLLSRVVPDAGIEVTNVDTTDFDAVRRSVPPFRARQGSLGNNSIGICPLLRPILGP